MLHKETIAPSTWELLKKLQTEDLFHGFRLVGGTSLALQLGHRKSVDLDLFSCVPFNEQTLSEMLIKKYGLRLEMIDRYTVKGEIDGVQIDCIAHEYPWLENSVNSDGVSLAGLYDISAMKLNAIAGNGTRIKDFIDIAYLSTKYSLSQMLAAYEKKYNISTLIPIKALSYWNDINMNEPICMLSTKAFKWKTVEKRLIDMLRHTDKIYGSI